MDHLGDDDLLALTPKQPEAFAVFYRRHERLLLGFFMRRTGEPELAADLAAETFAAALVSVRRFDAARGPALVRRQAFEILDRLRFDPTVRPDWRSSG